MRDFWDSEFWDSLSSSEKILVSLSFFVVIALFFFFAFIVGCRVLRIVGVF